MGTTDPAQLQNDVQRILGNGPADDDALDAILKGLLERLGCVAGTIHRLNPASGLEGLEECYRDLLGDNFGGYTPHPYPGDD
jgi:hypothetical protein